MTISTNIRGKVAVRSGVHKYKWCVCDPDGQVLAAGEEADIRESYRNAAEVVFAVRTWIMFGRGDLLLRSRYLFGEFKPNPRNER